MLDKCFSFILAFPSSTVSKILDRFSPSQESLILDPFCGTGTTLVECKRRGLASIGIDSNPVCTLAARVKTTWRLFEADAEEELKRVLGEVKNEYRQFELRRKYERDNERYFHPTKWSSFNQTKQGRFLIESGLLKRGWISPRPALKCLLIIQSIEKCKNISIKELLLISLLGLLVPEFSNVKYGPEIYCSRKRLDVDVFGIFEERVNGLISSIIEHRSEHGDARCRIFQKNSMERESLNLEPASITHVVTSPPYPAEHDYTRMTRLELAFGGFVSGKEDLRQIKRNMVPSSSKSSYVDQKFYDSVKTLSCVRSLRQKILSESKSRNHGFARVYPRLVGDYFGAMFLHFRSLKPYLKPGAQCAYVVGDQSSFFGIHIHTASILRKILESEELGFEVTGLEVLRNRKGTTGKNNRSIPETILFFKNPSNIAKPKCRTSKLATKL